MKMKLSIILWTVAACSAAAQHRRSRINNGRYYFGTNPPIKPNNHQRLKNSVAFTGSNNRPLTRRENTYNLENLNSIRRTSAIRNTTLRPSTTTRKKLRVVIRRRGNKYSYNQDKRYDQKVRYKLQDTGANEKYRLVDFGDQNNSSALFQLKQSNGGSSQASRSDNGNYKYKHKSSEQYSFFTNTTQKFDTKNKYSFGGVPSLDLEPLWKSDEESTRSNDPGTERKLVEQIKTEANLEKSVCSGRCPGSQVYGYGDKDSAILSNVQDFQAGGGYHFEYKTENRISGEERRTPMTNPDESEASLGYYQYTGPDNVVYRVDYRAGKEGFVPVAAHLPTPPPIPLAILRSLEYQKNYKI